MRYLHNTRNLVHTICADNLNIVKWWEDEAFGVHNGIKSNTYGLMSMGNVYV